MNADAKKKIAAGVLMALVMVVLIYQFGIKGTKPTPTATPAGKSAIKAPLDKAAAVAADVSAKSGALPKADKKDAKKNTDKEAQSLNLDIDELLAGIKEVDFDYEAQRQSRDPMMPLVGGVSKMQAKEGEGQKAAPSTVGQVMSKVVSGIMWDARRPLAVVDNEVVNVGFEYPDGTRVDSIERDKVVFKVGDSLVPVELKEH